MLQQMDAVAVLLLMEYGMKEHRPVGKQIDLLLLVSAGSTSAMSPSTHAPWHTPTHAPWHASAPHAAHCCIAWHGQNAKLKLVSAHLLQANRQ